MTRKIQEILDGCSTNLHFLAVVNELDLMVHFLSSEAVWPVCIPNPEYIFVILHDRLQNRCPELLLLH